MSAEKWTKPFYNSIKWRKLREKALKRDGYQCQESKRFGKYEEATTVHHIYPMEEYPEYAHCLWNLVSLCASRHESFHDKTNGKIVGAGLHWQKRSRKDLESEKPI